MTIFERLASSTVRQFSRHVPDKPEPPSADQLLAEDVSTHLQENSDFFSITFFPWLDHLIGTAEQVENVSITNQPVMLVNHGKVMALKELKQSLINMRDGRR